MMRILCIILLCVTLKAQSQNTIKVKKPKTYAMADIEGTWRFTHTTSENKTQLKGAFNRADTLNLLKNKEYQNIVQGVVYEGDWKVDYDEIAVLTLKAQIIRNKDKREVFAIPDARMKIENLSSDSLTLQTYIDCDKLINFHYRRIQTLKKSTKGFKSKNRRADKKYDAYFDDLEMSNCPSF